MCCIGKKAVEKTGVRVVGVTGFFGIAVMNVVRDNIDFFGDEPKRHVANKETGYFTLEKKGFMSRKAMIPYGSVAAHKHHAIEKGNGKQWPGKVLEKEDKEERRKRKSPHPAGKSSPVFFGREDINPVKKLFPKLPCRRFNKPALLVSPAISWWS